MIAVVAMAESHISDPLTADLRTLARWTEPDRALVRVSSAVGILAECLVDKTGAEYVGPDPTPGGEVRGEVRWREYGRPRRLTVYVRVEEVNA